MHPVRTSIRPPTSSVPKTTVGAYVSAVLTKLDPRDRVRAVVLTYENGFLPDRGPAARGRKPT